PVVRQVAHGVGVAGHPQRVGGAEVPVHALVPPAGAGVDDRVPAGAVVVGRAEVPDPAGPLALAPVVASRPVRVVLHVERTRKGLAVGRPATAVVHEEVGLSSTAGPVRQREVVGAADHADVVGPVVLLGEVRVLVAGAFGGLDEGEPHAFVPPVLPVHIALVAADVHSVHRRQRCVFRHHHRSAATFVLADLGTHRVVAGFRWGGFTFGGAGLRGAGQGNEPGAEHSNCGDQAFPATACSVECHRGLSEVVLGTDGNA